MPGSLYVVATPIGNVDDISARAIEVLRSCDQVVAEDTRHSGRLLARLGIDRPMRSLHEHSDSGVVTEMIRSLEDGRNLALVSDAGTPLISDPGFELVRAARQSGITVLPIPGPSAMISALSVSGLPTDQFRFCGFPPSKPAARRNWLESFIRSKETLVFYESSHRVAGALGDFGTVFGTDRPAFMAREMTKLYEQHLYGDLGQLAEAFRNGEMPSKGEFVLVVAGDPGAEAAGEAEDDAKRLMQLLSGHMSPSHAARTASAFTGVNRQRCYEFSESLKSEDE